MNSVSKTKAIFIRSLVLTACLSIFTTNAQQTVVGNDSGNYVEVQEALDPALLEQILAPIALYPDSLLSQILVASTYPLEVVQAARWRQNNSRLTEAQVLTAIENQPWDPSVKALAPFTDLIIRLSSDLDWLQTVGDAFLQNEYQVLASVQELRQKAYEAGSIADNDYYDVIIKDHNIIIEPTNKEYIYVPYYDSRVVYGHWKWKSYQPVYWHNPSHYRLHAGFYWSKKFYIRPTIFFGGFRWGLRSLVVNKHFYDKPYSRNSLHRNIGISHYRKWKHNPVHRRGVKYSSFGGKKSFNNNRFNSRSKFIKQNRIGINDQRRINNRNVSRNSRAVFNGNDSRRVQSNNRVQSGTRINNNITKREIYNGKTNRNVTGKQATKQLKKNNSKASYRPTSTTKIQSNKNKSSNYKSSNNGYKSKSSNQSYKYSSKGYNSKKSSFNRKASSSKSKYKTSSVK